MPNIELLTETNSDVPDPKGLEVESKPKTITFEFVLETGGTASFRMPLVQDLIDLGAQVDSTENNKLARILSDRCLTSWNGASEIPKEIDGADDSERLLIFLELLTPLVTQFDPDSQDEYCTTLMDGTRTVDLLNGDQLTLRRLTVKENLTLEDAKVASTERACRVASSACVRWWKERVMMPGDLYQLTLEDYGKVFKTLQSFRHKPAGKTRRRLVS
jgi:hypothetical protein